MDSNVILNIGMKKRNQHLNRWDSSPSQTLHAYLPVILFQTNHLYLGSYDDDLIYLSNSPEVEKIFKEK